MLKIFRLSFILFLISNLYMSVITAQELPVDPPGEPTDPVLAPEPELVKLDLNASDSQVLFTALTKWQLVVTDRQSKKIRASAIICVENMEGDRELGCSLYDDLHDRDVTKYNQNADSLFKVLVKHVPLECEEEGESCILTAEEVRCTLSAMNYSCSLDFYQKKENKK